MAARVGGRGDLGGPQPRRARLRPLEAEELRARDAPVPVRRAAHGPPQDLLDRRRARPLPPPARMRVIHPMGYDAFGLPAENHAIRTGEHPRLSTEASIETFRREFRSWGISIDWSREVSTHDPAYYRWTQWIFLKLLERGLAYRDEAPVVWCPHDQTVLANEQVIDGRCERCGLRSSRAGLEQWFFRITDYAQRLLDDFALLESWPEHVITMQRNWIGRSEGAEAIFRCEELGIDFPVFTTRPDTLFGATFFVLAPSTRISSGSWPAPTRSEPVREYVDEAMRVGRDLRSAEDRAKTGVPLGRTVTNPVNGEQIPMFVSDYVLMEYGTGAIMAVPPTTSATSSSRPPSGSRSAAWWGNEPAARRRGPEEGWAYVGHTENERLINSGRSRACPPRRRSRKITAWLEERGLGPARRQLPAPRLAALPAALLGLPDPDRLLRGAWRIVPVPEDQLPVVLPDVEDYAPKGKSPLAAVDDWVATECPRCGGPARRETDTMDTFVDSSWYFLRYLDPTQRRGPVRARDRRLLDARRPVHRRRRARDPAPDVRALLRQGARGHGLPRRAGAVRQPVHPGDDPPGRREDVEVEGQRRQPGRVRRALRRRHRACTSASWARPRRTPTGRTREWRAPHGFLRRVWRPRPGGGGADRAGTDAGAEEGRRPGSCWRKANWAIAKATVDLGERFHVHTAIAALMELVNDAYRLKDSLYGDPSGEAALRFATATTASLLFPFAPHLSSEVYEQLTGDRVWEQPWPVRRPRAARAGHDHARRPGQRQAPRQDRGGGRCSGGGAGAAGARQRAGPPAHRRQAGRQGDRRPRKLVNLVVR